MPAWHLEVPSFGYPGGPLDKPIEQAKKQAFDHIGLIGSFDMWSHTGSRPVHHAGTIYAAMDRAIFAVDAATGTVKWKKGQDLAENQFYRGSFYTSPAYANGKLFVGTADGHLVCFDAATGERRWSFRVGQQIESPPVVSQGRVVVTTVNGRVACVETGDPADTGWPTWGGNAARTGDSADAKITPD